MIDLHNAVKRNEFDLVKQICKKKEVINKRDKHGTTPLMLAASNGNLEIVKFLIENGADVNAIEREPDNNTALSYAYRNEHLDVFQFLIENGANINAKNKRGNPLFKETIGMHCDDCEYIEKHIKSIRLLVENGIDVNEEVDFYGKTLLMCVLEINNIEFAELLIEKGADVNKKNHRGQTPLWRVIYFNTFHRCFNIETVKFLIKNGADVNEGSERCTPLLTAIEKNNINLVKLLLDNGADVNKITIHKTPLITAIKCKNMNMDIIRLLLDNGADVDQKVPKECDVYNGLFQMIKSSFSYTTAMEVAQETNPLLVKYFQHYKQLKKQEALEDTGDIETQETQEIQKKDGSKGGCLSWIIIGFFVLHFFTGVFEGESNSFKATKTLNCRNQAGTHGQIIGKIAGGQSVSCSKFDGEWCQTVCDGKEGFVYKKFLSK